MMGDTNIQKNVTIGSVCKLSELYGIQQLQQLNLRKYLSKEEMEKEGFVTAEYSIKFLQRLHDASPSIIATDGEQVIGYALVALRSAADQHELLADLFKKIDATTFDGKHLGSSDYVVVGQLCVHKNYRGMGLVQNMYEYYRQCLSNQFEYCITDVSAGNPRSLKAHKKVGFQVISTLHFDGQDFDLILWDWNRDQAS